MANPVPLSEIKKRSTVSDSARKLSIPVFKAGKPDEIAYQRAATHEKTMQRFQLRKLPSDRAHLSNFGSDKRVIIDKAFDARPSKNHRFSLHRFLKSAFGRKARKRALRVVTSPITPDSWTYTVHGIVMLLVYHFQLLDLPFAPSFYPNGSYVTTVKAMVFETLFLLDLLLTLNTAYIDQGVLVTSRRKIARHYFRKWFALDLLFAFPLQAAHCLVTGSIDKTDPIVRDFQLILMALRLLRTTLFEKGMLFGRVMRVAHHLVEWVRYSRYSHLLGIAQLMWLVLLIAHYMACLWHVVAGHHTGNQGEMSIGEQYMADYYYAVSLIQGQGNGSGTWEENMYSSVAIIIGSVIVAIVFGNVAMLVSNFNANETNYHRKMEAVYATMDKMGLPLELRARVNEYYTHVWLEYEALDGSINKFQQELTHTLRIEIGLYKFMNLVVKIPFWEDCTPDFLTQIVLNLGVRVYMPDDYVVRRREIGNEMMMINLGYCKLSKPRKRLADAVDIVQHESSPVSGRPVLARQNTATDSELECYDGSDDENSEWDEEMSEDDSEDELAIQPRRATLNGRGSAFDLLIRKQNSQKKFDPSQPRRSSNPSSARIKQEPTFVYLKPGQAFGEMSLLMNYKRQASVRAVTFMEMCVLDRKTFQQIISRYPEDRRNVLTKMLENCIEKKEIPLPWENIIEAVTANRRKKGYKDTSRANVVATITSAEAAKVLVKAIDVNVPDESIKYGFQSFDHAFVDDSSIRRVNSVRAKIRDTLQRSNSEVTSRVSSFRSNSSRNLTIDSSRSATCELMDQDTEPPEGSTKSGENSDKTLENILSLLQRMSKDIGKLQQDMKEVKSQHCYHDRDCEVLGYIRSLSANVKYTPDSIETVKMKSETAAESFDHVELHSKVFPAESLKPSAPPVVSASLEYESRTPYPSRVDDNTTAGDRTPDNASQRVHVTSVHKSVIPTESKRLLRSPHYERRHASLSKRRSSGRSSPLADLLWKRNHAYNDQARDSAKASRRQRQLKTRHSMPAGVVADITQTETNVTQPHEGMFGISTDNDTATQQPKRHRGYAHFGRVSSNMDPRFLKIDE
ncbi:Potassium/sodium hyperpolarization-activated cyclic nucleotide-gated channel 4 [Phytophthora nicotianae]|nr:Potassium/sodium hyperpolarization-activated cyclic nucleotide-gated channel 4 [Phytophthora nicotianae]